MSAKDVLWAMLVSSTVGASFAAVILFKTFCGVRAGETWVYPWREPSGKITPCYFYVREVESGTVHYTLDGKLDGVCTVRWLKLGAHRIAKEAQP